MCRLVCRLVFTAIVALSFSAAFSSADCVYADENGNAPVVFVVEDSPWVAADSALAPISDAHEFAAEDADVDAEADLSSVDMEIFFADEETDSKEVVDATDDADAELGSVNMDFIFGEEDAFDEEYSDALDDDEDIDSVFDDEDDYEFDEEYSTTSTTRAPKTNWILSLTTKRITNLTMNIPTTLTTRTPTH